VELQFQTLRNQLTPHFIFNALNAIGSSIYQDDKEKSYDFLQRFSILIRSTLSHADKSYQTLREELEFVRNYLELERFRFENKFEYCIHIQEGINQEMAVPKMIIQTFAENAVKNGLIQKSGEGKLTVILNMEHENLKINLEDNGISIAETINKSDKADDSGIEIMKQFILLYNRFNSKKIDLQITDVRNKTSIIAGTGVTILLPTDFTYNSIPANL
jgi:LytS/YehU family sensor histidine kinase